MPTERSSKYSMRSGSVIGHNLSDGGRNKPARMNVHGRLTSSTPEWRPRSSQYRAMILVRFAISMFAFALFACAVSYSAAQSEQEQSAPAAVETIR
jgi:hypothetical protein